MCVHFCATIAIVRPKEKCWVNSPPLILSLSLPLHQCPALTLSSNHTAWAFSCFSLPPLFFVYCKSQLPPSSPSISLILYLFLYPLFSPSPIPSLSVSL